MSFLSDYLGILNKEELGEWVFSNENFSTLLNKNIIIPIEEIDESKPNSNWIFGIEDSYTISYNFLEDVYINIKNYVESLDNNSVFWYLNGEFIEYNLIDIQNSIETTLDNDEKILILKNFYKEINTTGLGFNLCMIKNENEVSKTRKKLHYSGIDYFPVRRLYIYFQQKNSDSLKKWKEWVFERFSTNSFIKRYLVFDVDLLINHDDLSEFIVNDSQYYLYDLVLIWSNFISIQKINNFCVNKIKELENKIIKTNSKSTVITKPKIDVKDKTLEYFFHDKKEYFRIIKQLKSREIFDDNLQILPLSKEGNEKPTEDRVISGIGFLCKNKGYLREIGEKRMQKYLVKVLSNTFNHDLKPNTYSTAQTRFAEFYPKDINEDPNLRLLSFI